MITHKLKSIPSKIDSDNIGGIGSALCLVHCFVTPFLFAAQATVSSTCSDISPTWWKMIDLVFLAITFIAVWHSSKKTILTWMPSALYSFWICFAILVLNNFFQFFKIPHALIYIPAICLSGLHLHNRRSCRCNVNANEIYHSEI